MKALKPHGLTIAFTLLLIASLVAQAFAGQADYNQQALTAGLPGMTMGEFLSSSHFAVDVAENWQSEYLQFFLLIMLAAYLVQAGSPESKEEEKSGRETDKEQKVGRYAEPDSPVAARRTGFVRTAYSHSLGLVMGVFFVGSWLAQLVAGSSAENSRRIQDHLEPHGLWSYAASPDFWNRSVQNWQSEFLAVASMVVLSIFLRERGSVESKPVGEPHGTTGQTG